MKYNYSLSDFIIESDFEDNVKNTIAKYGDVLQSITLKKFNKNVIDPIKLTFDNRVFNKSIDEIIELEIHRQRDKSNNNAIGYFHQYMFKYIKNCEVPTTGMDIIYTSQNTGKKIYVELKNKHNTMNDSAQNDTCLKLFNQLLKDPECIGCYLVEVIAPKSRNTIWKKVLRDGTCVFNEKIRRISIDKFYEIVTGKKDAFYRICKQIPLTIDKLIKEDVIQTAEKDTVISELKRRDPNLLKALYLLAFGTYNGFNIK